MNVAFIMDAFQAIGCTVVNMDSHILMEGIEHLVIGLPWQIIYVRL